MQIPRSPTISPFFPPPIDFRRRIQAGSERESSPVIENS